jgi:hypothetical protein
MYEQPWPSLEAASLWNSFKDCMQMSQNAVLIVAFRLIHLWVVCHSLYVLLQSAFFSPWSFTRRARVNCSSVFSKLSNAPCLLSLHLPPHLILYSRARPPAPQSLHLCCMSGVCVWIFRSKWLWIWGAGCIPIQDFILILLILLTHLLHDSLLLFITSLLILLLLVLHRQSPLFSLLFYDLFVSGIVTCFWCSVWPF